ncbi:MAG: hypothetical protein ACK5RG_07995 [Cyclobacteriaceae bacterium]|jgi:hypothetical protein|nr:hypothetical protein [Flammeovirgaceae bacterium]
MRNIVLISLLVAALASCTKESPLSEKPKELVTTSQQKWVLVKMTGAWGLGSTTGSAMQWQEYYVFNNDGTFSRYRQQDNATKTATGTFTTVSESDQQFMELTYTSGDELKTSCYPKERLQSVSAELLQGTWGHCDGPTLEYAKANETGQ